jgi:TPP-dependent pyruvate/acetoin dehydrogenase alpha subunit
LTKDTNLKELAPDTPVELANGVVLTAQIVIALELLENPAELLAELFTNPGAVMTALSNIGADMSDDEREESEKVIIASVIAGQAAVTAAGAAGAAAYRRKP